MGASLKRVNSILLRAIPAVLAIVGIKLLIHEAGWEFIPLNTVFSAIIGANIFLMSFLLSGVLADFKESERLPGELAAVLYTMSDEALVVHASKDKQKGRAFLDHLHTAALSIRSWFYKQDKTRTVMTHVTEMNTHFADMEKVTQPNYIVRLKQEQKNLRRLLIRIHTIRETSFLSSAYLLATTTSLLLISGLIFCEFDPYYESLFFVGVVSYVLVFLLLLIRDVDNPFGYYESKSSEDVSLKPLEDVIGYMEARLKETDKAQS